MTPYPDWLAERFHSYVLTEEGCWLWLGSLKTNGYGQFWDAVSKKNKNAHRVAYELRYDEIPEGLQLDHLCRNRACVNPEHLEPVDCRTNLLRGETLTAERAQQTTCAHGHAFTPENTYVKANGTRGCRACKRIRRRSGERVAVNDPAPQATTSSHRGVSWSSMKRAWRAGAQRNGERHELGYFADEQDAARAVADFWDRASVKPLRAVQSETEEASG